MVPVSNPQLTYKNLGTTPLRTLLKTGHARSLKESGSYSGPGRRVIKVYVFNMSACLVVKVPRLSQNGDVVSVDVIILVSCHYGLS